MLFQIESNVMQILQAKMPYCSQRQNIYRNGILAQALLPLL